MHPGYLQNFLCTFNFIAPSNESARPNTFNMK